MIGSVDQAISEALGNYLEEHPKEAKVIVDKVILAATARHAARHARKWFSANHPFPVEVCQVNWLTVLKKTRPSASFSWLRETLRWYGQTGSLQAIPGHSATSWQDSQVEKAMPHKVLENQEIRDMYTALGVSIARKKTPKSSTSLSCVIIRSLS